MLGQALFAVLLIPAASLAAFGASVTLRPVADTSLFENSPDSNLGATDLAAGTIRLGAKSRALIRFNLAGQVPANATITSADFTIRVSKTPPGAVPSTFGLHRVLQSWNEGIKGGIVGSPATAGESTWNARVFPGTPWSSPGAAAPADYTSKASATRAVAGLNAYTFASTADLVADVQAWAANPAANLGWILISQSEGTPLTARRFAAREDTSNGPSLVIQFTAPAQATPPSITAQPQNQTVVAGASATFSVTATGTEPLSYQWKFNNTDVTGATNPTLTLSNVQASNAGSYTVAVSNAAGSATSSAAVLTVNQPTPPSLSLSDASIAEGNSGTVNAVFTVSLSAASGQTVTVSFATRDSTATGGKDYQTSSGTFTFSPGQTNGTISVPVIGDTLNEPDETFFVSLANPVNATIANGQGRGTILDDDALPLISIQDASVSEGGAGTTAVFTVSLSTPSGKSVTVDFSTVNGTATAGNDYVPMSGTLAFAPGETNKSIAVPVTGDSLNEPNETFFVLLANPVNATIAKGQGLGTIIDDDALPLPVISIQDATVGEGGAGTTNAVFTVSLSAASGITVSVNFSTINETAIPGSDYTPASGTLTFNPGETTKTITIQVIGDAVVEPDESFLVSLSNPVNATISRGQAIGTILNDDFPLSITTQPQSQTVTTGGTASFTTAAVGSGTLRYQWKFNGTDITGATNPTFTLNNVQPGNAGNYTVVVTDANGSITSAAAILTVPSPTIAPSITLQPKSITVNAGGGGTFAVTATGTEPLSYQWRLNGAALAGATRSFLMLTNIQPDKAGSYSVVVSNPAGSVTSDTAVLTVNTIQEQPPRFDRIERAGDNLTIVFTVPADSALVLEFADSVVSGTWTTLTNVGIKASPQTVTVTDSISTSLQRFYRLKVTTRVQ